jgi:2-methylcitrate dehydratase PrpD
VFQRRSGPDVRMRRALLRGVGSTLLSTAVAPLFQRARAAEPAAADVQPVITILSRYMADAAGSALPDDVLEQTKLHIIDTIAAMVSGSTLLPGQAAIDFAKRYGGAHTSTVVASSIACGPIEATMANGVLAQADETDDSNADAIAHPGSSIVAAALATAEAFGVDGTRMVRSVALGYDVGVRFSLCFRPPDYAQTGRSTHSLVANFGSAAAAGCAAGLSARQMRWLLDYAAQQASGVSAWYRDTRHIEKAFVLAGMGARNGVTAALLVQGGWTGVDDILSGQWNFLSAYASNANASQLVDHLGERYEVVRTNIKKWSAGSPIQATLDALEILMKQAPFRADDVQSLVVRIASREAVVVDNAAIFDINLQGMVALMLIDGTLSFAAIHNPARASDAQLLRTKAKVTLIRDSELDELLPRRAATVDIRLNDGRELHQHVQDVRGTAQNPMTRDEVMAKARDLMSPILGTRKSKTLIERLLTLDSEPSVRRLRPLLQV